jgi:hypothetical protein
MADKSLEGLTEEKFTCGDKVKYSYGLTFTFIGRDPFDKSYAYCIHPSAMIRDGDGYEQRRIDRLPYDRLTKAEPNNIIQKETAKKILQES